MKLRVAVKPHLKLLKENLEIPFGEIFEVEEERGIEILKKVYQGKTVVEFVSENQGFDVNNMLLEKKQLEIKNDNLVLEMEKLKEEKEQTENKYLELLEQVQSMEENEKSKRKNKESE